MLLIPAEELGEAADGPPASLAVVKPQIAGPVAVSGFLQPEACRALVDEADDGDWADAMVVNSGSADPGRVDADLRIARERALALEDHPELFRRLASTLSAINAEHYGFDLTGWPATDRPIHLCYLGSAAGQFVEHVDLGTHHSTRKLSFTLQLSDSADYQGGDLVFPALSGVAPRTQGCLVLFPSYVTHAVTPVTRGARHSLTGWLHGRSFR